MTFGTAASKTDGNRSKAPLHPPRLREYGITVKRQKRPSFPSATLKTFGFAVCWGALRGVSGDIDGFAGFAEGALGLSRRIFQGLERSDSGFYKIRGGS